MDAGEQGGDDVLAQATPVIRATARGLHDAGLIEHNANFVGNKLTAGHLRDKFLTSAQQGGNRTLPVVLLTPAK